MTSQTTSSSFAFDKNNCPDIVLNSTKDSYLLVDKELNIQYFNAVAAQEIKDKCGIIVLEGMSVLNLVPAERKPYIKELYSRVLSGQDERTENSFVLPGKATAYFENLFMPAFDARGTVIGVVVRSTNISEEKNIELRIKEAEERWRFALEAANQGAWDWNMQTNEVIYSGSYQKMYGFGSDELKSDLLEWESRIHPDDKLRMQQAIGEHIQSDDTYYESTYRLQLKNGTYKWIMARGKMVDKDSEGKPLRMIGTHTDLTETIETQKQLNTIAERFAYAAKASGQALWEWNALTGEAYVSPSFTELFGWEADTNQHFEQWHSYIHADDKKQTVKSYYSALEDTGANTWEAEYRFLKANGSYAVVCDTAYIIRDENGKAVKVIGATQDITAKKKTEEELYKSNQRFDNMLMATHDLLWDWDMQADHVYRSEKNLQKVYGLTNDHSIKKIRQWMERVHPEDQAKLRHIFKKLPKASHQQTFEIEYRFKKDDGTYAYIYDRGILLKDEEGKPLRIIGAAQDVSERKRLEAELLANELEYKKLINQATVDSQEQERSEIGKELHDNINQVLTTTKLYLELAADNESMMKELVKKATKTITSVITEIRQLSRSLMDPSINDLGIVDSINDLVENINLTQKIWVTLHIDQSIERVLDKKQHLTVYRIIQEALNNILKHAGAKKAAIRISVIDNMAGLLITDDGTGFKQDAVKKGAGLKNISNRVYLINGSLKIESGAGKGCTIHISFPIKTIK